VLWQKFANGFGKIIFGKMIFDYAGIGIAMLTLIDSTVRVTISQSDSEPIASEAATASVSRGEATGAERLPKPAAPGDRIMVQILQGVGESPTREEVFFGSNRRQYWGGARWKTAKWRRKGRLCLAASCVRSFAF
jgi:hypothetical protein